MTVSNNLQQKEELSKDFEIAVGVFSENIGTFLSLADNMTKNELRRVLKALIEYPLNSKPPHFTNDKERAIFNLGTQLTQSKMIMLKESLKGETKNDNSVQEESSSATQI